jgi:talin
MSNFQVAEVDTILTATDRLFGSMGDTPEMVKQARVLAQATSHLVNALKLEAESHEDSDQQKRLLSAARVLADATARMVEAAKVTENISFVFALHELKYETLSFMMTSYL